MLESEYKRDIREALAKIGAKTIPIVTSSLTEKGTPDIIGTYKGKCFVVEAKIFPNQPTEIQKIRLEEWANAGALTVVMLYPIHPADILATYIQLDSVAYHQKYNEFSTWEQWQKDFNERIAWLMETPDTGFGVSKTK